MSFIFREAPSQIHEELDAAAKAAIEEAGLKVGSAHCAVEAKPFVQWHKGAACLHILEHEWGPQWAQNSAVVYAGDDTTDEDAFKALAGHGLTIRVTASGEVATAAELRVPSTGALLEVLRSIADQLDSQQ